MIKIFSFLLLLIFIFSADCTNTDHNNDFPFEKKVWSFWDADDFSQAPIIVQACYEKIKMSAQKAGFEYILLNSKNLPQYISNYEGKILKVREKSYQEGLPAFADLVRMNVIHEYGGIWMDITEVLIDNFDWLVNIKSQKYRNLITNRFSQQPDVFLFYFPAYQNSAQHRIQSPNNKNQTILYNQIPGFQAWFIAAKKNSSLIGQIKDSYTNFTQTPYKQLFRLFIEEDIYMHNQDGVGYLTINYAISYVLQKKQRQLDKLIGIFGNRQNVFEYYNLWGLSALLGPLSWTTFQSVNPIHFIDRPKEYFQENGWIIKFVVKVVGGLKQRFTQKLNYLKNILIKYQQSFQNFIKSAPSEKACQEIYFLVKGSLLYNLFVNTTHLQKNNITIISQRQNQQWQTYCFQKYQINKQSGQSRSIILDILDTFFLLKNRAEIPWYKAHNTVNYGKDYSSDPSQKLKDWLFANSGSLGFWLKFLIDSSFWFFLQFFIFKLISKKYLKQSSSRNVHNHSQSSYLTSLAIILCNTVSLYEYHMVDYFGERDRPFETFVSVIVIFMLQNFIENRVTNDHGNQLCYDVAYSFISFRTTFTAFSLLRNNKNRLTFYSIIIGLAGPCLMRLYERMESQKTVGSFVSKFLYKLVDKNIHRKALVILLFCIWLVPNTKYILVGDHYIMSFIPVILFTTLIVFYAQILYESFRRASKIQLIRLSHLGVLSLLIFYMLPLRNQVLEHNSQRMLWTFLAITIYQSIFVQIGSQYLKLRHQTRSVGLLSSLPVKLIICFGILLIELVFGSFFYMTRISIYELFVYIEALTLGVYNFIIALYLFLDNATKQQNQNGLQKFERIQMCTQIEQEITE